MEYSNPLNSREKVIWEKWSIYAKHWNSLVQNEKEFYLEIFLALCYSQYFHFWIETTQVSDISYCQIHGFVTHILNMSVEMQIGKNYVLDWCC